MNVYFQSWYPQQEDVGNMGISEAEYELLKQNQRIAADADHCRSVAKPNTQSEIEPTRQGRKRRQNKWETAYAAELEIQLRLGLILWYQFEGMRFRLADGAWYKPDFVVLSHTGELMAIEVKGFWREASRVRIKVAADRHPFRFIAVRKRKMSDGGDWEKEMFSAMLDRIKPYVSMEKKDA